MILSSLTYRLLKYGEQSYRHKWIDFINTLHTMKYFLQHKRPQYIFCIVTALYFLTRFLY